MNEVLYDGDVLNDSDVLDDGTAPPAPRLVIPMAVFGPSEDQRREQERLTEARRNRRRRAEVAEAVALLLMGRDA